MQTQTTFSQKHRTPIKQDFFAHLKVSTGSFLRGFHTQSACHLEQLILKYLNLFYQYHLPRTFSLAYSGRLFVWINLLYSIQVVGTVPRDRKKS